MRIPVDVNGVLLIAGSDPAAVMDQERRPRADRATGEMLWSLDVVALGLEDGAQVWSVKVAGEPTGIATGQPVRVSGLVASPWEIEGRHGISFRARSIKPAESQSGSRSKPATAAAA